MINGWLVEISLDNENCDYMHDEGVREINLPFIPRIGETLYPSKPCCDGLISKIKKCWDEECGCEDCPFRYSEQIFSVDSYSHVKDVIYKVDEKIIQIVLSSEY